MSRLTLLHPNPEPAPLPMARGRWRVLMPIVAAVALHALVLLSSARPTLIGSAARDAPPAMLVRMLEPRAVHDDVATEVESGVASINGSAPMPESQSPVKVLATADGGHASAAVRPEAALPASAPSAGSNPLPVLQPGLPPAPAYLAAGRLDPGPRPLEEIEPAYPEEAKLQEGSVVLRLLINEAGRIDDVAVVRAYPQGLFEKAALDAFGSARFSPGMRFGVAVKSQLTIEVMFTPINRGARVSGRSY